MISRIFWIALPLLCLMGGAVQAAEACAYERAYSADSGTVRRVGDMLVIHVEGRAPGSGWTDARLAAVPEETGPTKLGLRLIACAPSEGGGGTPGPISAETYVIAQPGRLRDIVVRAATNELHLHDDTLG